MCRNNLSRSDEGNVRIASSISRAVLINAYDTAGDRAGKGDRNAVHVSRVPHSSFCRIPVDAKKKRPAFSAERFCVAQRVR
jgi:hypothetical protein